MKRRILNAAAAIVGAAVLLTGCTDSEQPSAEVFIISSSESAENPPDKTSSSEPAEPVASENSAALPSAPVSSSSAITESVVSSKAPEPTGSDISAADSQSVQTSAISEPEPLPSSEKTEPVSEPEPTSVTEPEPEPASEPEPISAPDAGLIPSGYSDVDDYESKWAYNQLTSGQKKIYEKLFYAAQNHEPVCDVSNEGLSLDEIDPAYWAFDYDNAQFLTLGDGYGYRTVNGELTDVSIQYGRKDDEIYQSDFDYIVKGVIDSANQYESDYERLKYIHDWIVNHTSYLFSNYAYESEADGPVIYGVGRCEGYSKAFMYMAQAMGFPCVCLSGYANGGEHMWNMVCLDGNWYHVDVTWDDPVSSEPMLRYDYFLVSEQTILADHSIDTPFDIPYAPDNY